MRIKFLERIKGALKGFAMNPRQFFYNMTSFASHLRRKSVESDPAGNYAGWVYASLSKRAKRVAAMKFHLLEMAANGDIDEIDDHELLSLLYRANPTQSSYQFLYTLEIMLGIWGSAPVYKERAGKKIVNLWPLRPDMLTMIPDLNGMPSSYEYRVGGKTQSFPAADVVVINEPNPLNFLLGYSPLQAAGLEIDADMAAAVWNKSLLENWAEPGVVLTTEQKLDDKEFERLQKTWNARNAGPGNAGRTALLEKGLKPEKMGRSPQEMDMVENRKFHRSAITSILGVPISLMAPEDSNLANTEAAERIFCKDTIEPQMTLIISTLNEFMVPEFGDNLYLDFDSPVPEDVNQKITLATAGAAAAFMTKNEQREIFNLPPLKGGDSIFVPLGLIPQVGDEVDLEALKSAAANPVAYKELPVKAGERVNKKHAEIRRYLKARTYLRRKLLEGIQKRSYEMITDLLKAHDHGKVKVKIKGAKAVSKKAEGDDDDGSDLDPRLKAERIEFLKKLPKAERTFRTRIKSYFASQRDEVLKNLEDEGLPKAQAGRLATKANVGKWINKILFDKKKQDDLLLNIAGEMYKDNIRTGAEAVAGLLGLDPSEILGSPFVIDFIQDRSFLMLAVNETTTADLKATLEEGVALGENGGQIRDRISKVYDAAQGFRAETIARTETTSAQNFGRLAEMENQKVSKKVWIATLSKTRDAHIEANGQVVPVNESFSVGGESLEYPGDPSGSPENVINCQCSVSPTLG